MSYYAGTIAAAKVEIGFIEAVLADLTTIMKDPLDSRVGQAVYQEYEAFCVMRDSLIQAESAAALEAEG